MPVRTDTERLVLRWWAEADAAWHRTMVAERDHPPDDTASYSANVVVDLRRRTETQGFGPCVVVVRAGCDGIGRCGLTVGRSTLDEPDLASEPLRRAHGKGHATEAAGGGHGRGGRRNASSLVDHPSVEHPIAPRP